MAVVTDSAYNSQIDTIRNETVAGANTTERIADAFQNGYDTLKAGSQPKETQLIEGSTWESLQAEGFFNGILSDGPVAGAWANVVSVVHRGGTGGVYKRIVTRTSGVITKDTQWIRLAEVPEQFAALSTGSTTTWDVTGKYVNNKILTLSQNTTLAFTGLVNGMEGSLVVIQDAIGSRTLTPPSGSLPSTALPINTAANSVTFVGWKYDGTRIFWTAKLY
jgi:hypothetical protein